MAQSMASALAARQASANAQAAINENEHKITLPSELLKAVENPEPITNIQLDALAASKIIKHSSENSNASGILLGVDILGTLEVSNVYAAFNPIFNTGSNDEDERRAKILKNQYNSRMCRNLSDVDMDDQPVGVYISTNYGGIINEIILDFASILTSKNRSFVIINDASSSNHGNFNLKAFRLTDTFINALRNHQFTSQGLIDNSITYHSILEPLPLQIKASALANAFLTNLSNSEFGLKNTQLLENKFESNIEGNVDHLIDSLDNFKDEQNQVAFSQRQYARERSKVESQVQKANQTRQSQQLPPLSENEIQKQFKLPSEPSKLPLLMLLGQIDGVSQRLQHSSIDGIAKIYGDGFKSTVEQDTQQQ